MSVRRCEPPDACEADGPDAAGGEPFVVPIGDALDLHGFHPRELPAVVDAYLEAALERGLCEVRLIHGRGRGVQRARVREQLARDPRVVRFSDAPAALGGWGATIARLAAPTRAGRPPEGGSAGASQA